MTEHSVPNWINRYSQLLMMTLKHRKLALSFAFIFLIGSISSVAYLPIGFMPEGDISVSQIEVELPPGTLSKKLKKQLGIWLKIESTH